MKKFISISLLTIFTTFLFAQNTITIKVPKFDEDGNISYEEYQRDYPKNEEEYRVVINALLNSYETTSEAYVKHIDKLAKQLENTANELDETKKLYEKTLNDYNQATIKIDEVKEENYKNVISFGNIKFGLTALYGHAISESVHDVDIQFNIKFNRFQLNLGPGLIVRPTSEEAKPNSNIIIKGGFTYWLN